MAEYRENPQGVAGIQYASAKYARRVAEDVENDIVAGCPVDTGLLVSTIRAESVGDTVYITIGTDYWAYVEYGTSKMAAQPFIRPALSRRRGVVDLGIGLE